MITLQLARKADECSAKTEVFSLAINKTSGGLYYNRPFDSGPLMTAVVNAHSRLRGAICRRILPRASSAAKRIFQSWGFQNWHNSHLPVSKSLRSVL